DGEETIIETVLTRQNVAPKPMRHGMIAKGIGYLHLHSIDNRAPSTFSSALSDMKKTRIRALVLDLRDAGGTDMDAAAAIASLFLKQGMPVFTKETAAWSLSFHKENGDGPYVGLRIAVLLNAGTRNAAEVLAAALADDLTPEGFLDSVATIDALAQSEFPGNRNKRNMRDSALKGMYASADRYSRFMTPQIFNEYMDMAHGRFSGTGVITHKKKVGSPIDLVKILPSSAAQDAGLKDGDKITRINGRSTLGLSGKEVNRLLRGPQGSRLKVTVLRTQRNTSKKIEANLIRKTVDLPVIHAETFPGRVGYLYLESFPNGASKKFRAAASTLITQGARSLIVDLRFNPGGSVFEALTISCLFLPGDARLIESRATTRIEATACSADGLLKDIPLAILINGESASASEIVAGILQDHKRATLIGSKSFGKGIIQSVFKDIPEAGYGAALTTARYHLPSGRFIGDGSGGGGIDPDIRAQEGNPIAQLTHLTGLLSGIARGAHTDDDALTEARKTLMR
ncbi:MAG: S41 family peptidase, partial [Elusimicrobiota bacterium]